MNSPRATLLILLALGLVLALAIGGGAPSFSGDDIASLLALGIVGTMIGAWALAEIRSNAGESLRNLLIWAVLVLLIMFGYQNRAMFGLAG